MKLTTEEKADLRGLKGWVKAQGGKIISNKAARMTTAFIPAVRNKQSRFVKIAFSYCSDSDRWNKKRGELLAAERLYYGQFTTMKNTF